MKRSNKVVLTAIFLTAVSAATARAQDVPHPAPQPQGSNDSTDTVQHSLQEPYDTTYTEPRSNNVHVYVHHTWFFGLFGRHRGYRNHPEHHYSGHTTRSGTATATTTGPRTRGFGTTMARPATSAHS